MTKIDQSKKDEKRKLNEKLSSDSAENVDVKNHKQGISRSCSDDNSASLVVQTGSTVCSLSATSQYSTDTVIAEDPMDTTAFNR